LDDSFKVNEVIFSHRRLDGKISPQLTTAGLRDVAMQLLLHYYSMSIRARSSWLKQFRVPTLIGRSRDDATTTNGWMTEVIAGMINENKTAEDAIRTTLMSSSARPPLAGSLGFTDLGELKKNVPVAAHGQEIGAAVGGLRQERIGNVDVVAGNPLDFHLEPVAGEMLADIGDIELGSEPTHQPDPFIDFVVV
jgi:hypothetical protein